MAFLTRGKKTMVSYRNLGEINETHQTTKGSQTILIAETMVEILLIRATGEISDAGIAIQDVEGTVDLVLYYLSCLI